MFAPPVSPAFPAHLPGASHRWKTVRCSTMGAMSWMTWTPDAPVPMTPTRFPARSTPLAGHEPVWRTSPLNESRPGMLGERRFVKSPVHLSQEGERHYTRYFSRRPPSPDHSAGTKSRFTLGTECPPPGRVVPDRRDDRGVVRGVGVQLELLRNVSKIREDLRLARESLRPPVQYLMMNNGRKNSPLVATHFQSFQSSGSVSS